MKKNMLVIIIVLLALGTYVVGGFCWQFFGDNTIHLIKNSDIYPVSRNFSKSTDIYTEIYTQLAKGPNWWERLLGVNTAIPKEMQLIAVNVDGDTVYLDFVDDIEQWRGSAHEVRLAIAQIVYSYTELSNIKKVAFFVEGKKKELVLGSDGFVINKPLSRVDINSINKE